MTNDDCVYKYVTADVGIKILQNKTIRFSNPKTFNDPYDSAMPIILKNPRTLTKEYYINTLKQIKTDPLAEIPDGFNIDERIEFLKTNDVKINRDATVQINEVLTSLKKHMRILCLSKINNNILMWGHYADSHRGIVIGFNKNSYFYQNARNVTYKKAIPRIKGELLKTPLLNNSCALKELNQIMLTKSKDWKYEKECRCIIDVEKEYKAFSSDISNCPPEFYEELKTFQDYVHVPFYEECIDSIYLGNKISDNDEMDILSVIGKCYPHVKVYKAYLSNTSFKMYFQKKQ